MNNQRFYRKKKSTNNDKQKDDNRPARKNIDENPYNPDDPDDETLNVYALEEISDSEFYASKLYFEKKDDCKNPMIIKKIKATENFMLKNPDIATIPLKAGPSFNIDAERFYKDEEFMNQWTEFEDDLKNDPRVTLNCLGLALHQVLVTTPVENLADSIDTTNLPMLRVKIINHKPNVPLRDIKVNYYGKLISTRGCVVRVGRTKHLAQWIPFSCVKCSHWQMKKQTDGIYITPSKCKSCGGGKFNPRFESEFVKTVQFQTVKLQEHFDAKQDDRGKMPRILEVELMDDLVESCMPGDDITVVGIIKVRGTDDGITKGIISGSNSLYMEAISIVNNKNKSKNKVAIGIDLDIQDYFAIKQVHDSPDVFSLLVQSLCPAIYGHEIVKAGLLLSLIGGSMKHASLRDDIHVLIVGDPGLGKSQMLQACYRVATKGVYVCGNSSTSSGLTVTLSKENGTSDFALEPGALVLADKGSCLIDEFDKMPTQHQALLEAMEQSRVSVAKSGIICSLPARTSILAAANPIGGRYDRSKTVTENLNLSQPLLSRFDLIFLLLDQPDKQLDSLMCAHVMNAHTGFKRARENENSENNGIASNRNLETQQTGLMERLLSFTNEVTAIPQTLLRKYISYARQYVKPKLSIEAAQVLQEYYLQLREMNNIFGSLPIFHRQLEALIRLTEARAKLELRVEATVEDAQEVVEIYKYTLATVPPISFPEAGRNGGKGKVTANKVNAFMILMKDQDRNKLFSLNELEEIAEGGGIVLNNFNQFIRKLNEEGMLIKRGNDTYKFVGY